MPVQNITFPPVGLVGVNPQLIYIETDDTYATVTATGYLNKAKERYGNNFSNQQMAEVYTTDEGPVWLKVVVTTTNVSLVQISSPGDVALPTIANHVIVSTDTAGSLANLSGTAINSGSLQAGLSGTAGTLISYPATASRGSLIVAAVANTGNTNVTISNAAHAQASVYSIPDGGQANSNFIISNSAGTQTIATGSLSLTAGNITAAAGNIAATLGSLAAGTTVTAGTGITATTGNITASAGNVVAGASGALGVLRSFPSVAASGYLELAATTNTSGNFHTTIGTAAAIAQSQAVSIPDCGGATGVFVVATGATPFTAGNFLVSSTTGGRVADSGAKILSGVTAVYGGGGTSNAFTVTGLGASSHGSCVIRTSTNAVSIVSAVPSADTLTVTFSADPGANTTVDYIYTTAALS